MTAQGKGMAKKKKKDFADAELKRLEEIKRLVVIAMFSDDVLLELLVLKGGNALDLIHRISTRASRDLDFSMQGDFAKDDLDVIKRRVEASLTQTLGEAGLAVFDLKMEEVPKGLTPDVADFWGGYGVEFKVIERATFEELGGAIDVIRKHALKLGAGESTKFSIDISKYEYVVGKQPQELSGYRIFAYSPEMMVCEKLRAICQQMPEYGPVVKRSRAGGARARDFLDIHTLVTERTLDMASRANQELLEQIFLAKRVPLSLLKRIANTRDFHRENFLAVKDTVKPGVVLEPFDFYFDFVLKLISTFKLDAGADSGAID
jgi:Nucleotidyl transferase AbiEii toxin, Type IV TA system